VTAWPVEQASPAKPDKNLSKGKIVKPVPYGRGSARLCPGAR